MTLLDILDAIQVHAAGAAAAANSKFVDVAVRFPAARGKSVSIFYGGEREAEHFDADRVLDAVLVGQAVIVRGYWPISDTGASRQRLLEAEVGTFAKSLRTRILADSQLGGACTDLSMGLTRVETVVEASTKYVVSDTEIVVEFDEFPLAP